MVVGPDNEVSRLFGPRDHERGPRGLGELRISSAHKSRDRGSLVGSGAVDH